MHATNLLDSVLRYEAGIAANDFNLLPNLSVYRKEEANEFQAVLYRPVICLILQGSKETTVGAQTATVRPGDALLVSHDLPVGSRITEASPEKPYIALILALDLSTIRSLYDQVGEEVRETTGARSLAAAPADESWVTPLARYLALAHAPLDREVLGPALLREIHYRLLMSPIGAMLGNLLSVDSHASRIAKAILKIRSGFKDPLAVPELARTAGMSVSSYHEHFRTVTGTTPLQYQKDLRMIEARALLQGGGISVSSASFEVGYESATHFSRDYARKFGVPPSRDIERQAAA